MKMKLLLVIVSLVLLVGLQACSTISTPRQEAVYPEKTAMAIEEADAAVTIMVNEKGELSFKDTKGENFGLCRMPGTKTSDPDLPVCKVSEQKMTVNVMKALPILESKGSGCITVGPDALGHYWEYCW